jgi:hypothetical protein
MQIAFLLKSGGFAPVRPVELELLRIRYLQ